MTLVQSSASQTLTPTVSAVSTQTRQNNAAANKIDLGEKTAPDLRDLEDFIDFCARPVDQRTHAVRLPSVSTSLDDDTRLQSYNWPLACTLLHGNKHLTVHTCVGVCCKEHEPIAAVAVIRKHGSNKTNTWTFAVCAPEVKTTREKAKHSKHMQQVYAFVNLLRQAAMYVENPAIDADRLKTTTDLQMPHACVSMPFVNNSTEAKMLLANWAFSTLENNMVAYDKLVAVSVETFFHTSGTASTAEQGQQAKNDNTLF